MTDTDRMVVSLREAMDAAQRVAEAAAEDGTPDWHTEDHFVVADGNGEAVVYDEGRPTPDQVWHIVRNDPATVLRRIAADRKMLELHRAEPGQHPDFCGYDKHQLPCPAVRLLAEGYGWTGETT